MPSPIVDPSTSLLKCTECGLVFYEYNPDGVCPCKKSPEYCMALTQSEIDALLENERERVIKIAYSLLRQHPSIDLGLFGVALRRELRGAK